MAFLFVISALLMATTCRPGEEYVSQSDDMKTFTETVSNRIDDLKNYVYKELEEWLDPNKDEEDRKWWFKPFDVLQITTLTRFIINHLPEDNPEVQSMLKKIIDKFSLLGVKQQIETQNQVIKKMRGILAVLGSQRQNENFENLVDKKVKEHNTLEPFRDFIVTYNGHYIESKERQAKNKLQNYIISICEENGIKIEENCKDLDCVQKYLTENRHGNKYVFTTILLNMLSRILISDEQVQVRQRLEESETQVTSVHNNVDVGLLSIPKTNPEEVKAFNAQRLLQSENVQIAKDKKKQETESARLASVTVSEKKEEVGKTGTVPGHPSIRETLPHNIPTTPIWYTRGPNWKAYKVQDGKLEELKDQTAIYTQEESEDTLESLKIPYMFKSKYVGDISYNNVGLPYKGNKPLTTRPTYYYKLNDKNVVPYTYDDAKNKMRKLYVGIIPSAPR